MTYWYGDREQYTTPHSSLLHLHSALASDTGDAANHARNDSLFGATPSTPDPYLEESQRQILLSTFSSPKDSDPSISWTTYQSPSSAPPITAFLAIARNENNELRLCLISSPQPNDNNPCATVRV